MTNQQNDASLIVDFPRQPRRASFADSSSSPSSHYNDVSPATSKPTIASNSNIEPLHKHQQHQQPHKKQVRISPSSQMYLFRYPTPAENALKWTNRQDHRHYRETFKQERQSMGRLLANKTVGEISNDELLQCVGLEAVLCTRIARKIALTKCKHSHVVLEEQSRIRGCDGDDAEGLARVSEESSRWSRERAHMLASRYAGILKV